MPSRNARSFFNHATIATDCRGFTGRNHTEGTNLPEEDSGSLGKRREKEKWIWVEEGTLGMWFKCF